MQITPGTAVRSQEQFEWMQLRLLGACLAAMVMMGIGAPSVWSQQMKENPHDLELSRAVRPWEFLPVTGTRAGLLGNESGRMEAWVYPLKIFREFHLKFHTEGRVLAAEALARTVTVAAGVGEHSLRGGHVHGARDLFRSRAGTRSRDSLDVETEQPLEIEAFFHRDFQLEWPAALGATYLDWNAQRHAFYFGEEQKKFVAFVGSQRRRKPRAEFQDQLFREAGKFVPAGPTTRRRKLIRIAGSLKARGAEKTYQHLTSTTLNY